jgi:UDP-N-acetylglucosamine--N-acetylmuramyl-(pentapeptide) pyrophosphoryl-undecaprenol N-acetylglucosamine transferase
MRYDLCRGGATLSGDLRHAAAASRRLLIAGGGTGGHLFPGVALAEAILARDPSVEITFVGTRDGLEARVIPRLGHALRFLPAAPLSNQRPMGVLRGLAGVARTVGPAVRLLRDTRPGVVVSLGRFASGVPGLLGALRHRPVVLLEQNTVPGLTNRILARVASLALLGFDEARPHLHGVPCETPGTPLRRDLVRAALALERRPPHGRELHVLLLGGSGGASSLNRLLPPALCRLAAGGVPLRVRHQTGLGKLDEVSGAYESLGAAAEITEFIDDIGPAYAWADLLLGRAGGGTVAEALALGLPAVFVPLPTRDCHQRHNADAVVRQGAGVVLTEDEIGRGCLEPAVAALARDPGRLDEMSARARAMARPNAADDAAEHVLGLLRASAASVVE